MVEQATGVKMPIYIGFGYIPADFHDDPFEISFNADSLTTTTAQEKTELQRCQ